MFFKLGLTIVTYHVEMYGKMRQPVFIRFLSYQVTENLYYFMLIFLFFTLD